MIMIRACEQPVCETCARRGHLIPAELGVVCTGDPETCTAYKKDRTGFEVGFKYDGGTIYYVIIEATDSSDAIRRALLQFDGKDITKIWVEKLR